MRVSEVLPVAGTSVDIGTDAGRAWLAGRYRVDRGRFVRLNMVTTLTGAAAGADGTSDTLTSRIDRAILGLIRAEADVVVVGAASVRAEGYVVPRRAALAIVSTSGRLDGHRLDEAEAGRVLMLVPGDARVSALPGVEVVRIAAAGPLHPTAVLSALAARGLNRVVCEGGPRLATQFAAAGVIDEYCITVAPRLTPVSAPILALADTPELTPVGMLCDEAGFSYLRLRPGRADAASR